MRSDGELIRLIKSGDAEAMEELIRHWYPQVFKYVFSFTENEDDSYDITQEIFLAVIKNIDRYIPWRQFKGWLFSIAHNKTMDYFRMKRKNPSFVPLEDSEPSYCFEEELTDSMTVNGAVSVLNAALRQVIILHYLYGYTAKQISEMLGTPLPTVKSRIVTARRKLKEILEESCDE